MKKIDQHVLQNKLDTLFKKPVTKAQQFHESTKTPSSFKPIPSKNWPREWTKIYYKSYARFPEVSLPKPTLSKSVSFKNVLLNRSSQRTFSKKPLTLQEISSLLYFSAGLKDVSKPEGTRFYPSGGARYPLEVYVLSLNSALPRGVYHYYPKSHSLEELLVSNDIKIEDYFYQPFVREASCIFIISAIFERNVMKYEDRGYRYLLTDAGHMGQNIYLMSAALKLNCCANEAFYDDRIHSLLDIDGVTEAIVYSFILGKSK